MWRSQNLSRYGIVGVLLFLLLLGGGWLFAGRLSLFQTSSYISLFGLWSQELYRENALWLSDGAEIQQDFISKYPGLYKVSVFLTTQKKLSQDVRISMTFHLRETCDSQRDLRQVMTTISTGDIDGDVFYPFTFVPIDESTNREFCFVLDSIAIQNEGDVLGVWASSLDVYSEGQAFYRVPLEDKPVATDETTDHSDPKFNHRTFLPIIQKSPPKIGNSDVGFQLHYNGRPLEMLYTLLIRLTEHKPYFFGNPGFYVFLFIVYVVGLFLLIWRGLTEHLGDK